MSEDSPEAERASPPAGDEHRPSWITPALAAGFALALATPAWIAQARGNPAAAAAVAYAGAVIGAALVVPWCAALATRDAWWERLAWAGASLLAAVVLAQLPAGGPAVGHLWRFAVLLAACGAWWAALVAAGRAWGLAPMTAQALGSLMALAQCASPCVAEAVVAAAPEGLARGLALDLVTGGNPLIVTGRSILGLDVWHLPWLYARADVAGYGTPQVGWLGAAAGHALAAAAAGGVAWWGARRATRA